jgi:hypothetical protein
MNWIKRWLARAVREGLELTSSDGAMQPKTRSRLTEMLTEAGPSIMIWRIENGYMIREIDQHSVGGFAFCADHKEIADYIISTAARKKLGVGYASQAAQGIMALGTLTYNKP